MSMFSCVFYNACASLSSGKTKKTLQPLQESHPPMAPRKNTLPTLTNMLNRGMVYLEKYAQTSVLCKIAP